MKHPLRILGPLVAAGCMLYGSSGAAAPGEDELLNNGEDITKPVNRFDMRYQFKTLPDVTDSGQNFDNVHAETLTLRTDWVLFNKPDQLAFRVDLPIIRSNKPNSLNKNGATQTGIGDLLVQAVYVRTLNARWAAGIGMQMIVPTATGDAFGSGKWQLAPTVGVRANLPEISAGSYAGMVVRQFTSVGGDDSRSNVNYTSIQPQINFELPALWFITTSPNIRCNSETGKWFVPFDIMVGKKFGVHWVASVEYQYGLVTGYQQYNEWVEARLGYFF